MYTTTTNDAQLAAAVMERIGKSWDTRVAVRKERLDLSGYTDPDLPDFPVSMVPFWDDPDFAALDDATKRRFLGCAWVTYNEKAIYLEDAVVNPLFQLLLRNALPGVGDPRVKQVIAQILVDEQFHILMCLDICNVARDRHDLHDYVSPEPNLGARQREVVARCADDHEATIARLAYATVSECSINEFLNQVADDRTIQPLNRINTDMHRRDESVHGPAVRQIASSIYRAMDEDDRRIYRHYLNDALTIFTTPDAGQWGPVLDYLEIPRRDAVMARLEERFASHRLKRDYANIRAMFEELGITESVGFAFA